MRPSFNIAFTTSLAVLGALAMVAAPANAKEWTIYERQTQLMKDVNDAQKSGDLTDKEAKSLRHDLAEVARKKAKMKDKSDDGEPTIDNKIVLEKDLNKVSVALKKLSLQKRIKAKKAEKAALKEAAKNGDSDNGKDNGNGK